MTDSFKLKHCVCGHTFVVTMVTVYLQRLHICSEFWCCHVNNKPQVMHRIENRLLFYIKLHFHWKAVRNMNIIPEYSQYIVESSSTCQVPLDKVPVSTLYFPSWPLQTSVSNKQPWKRIKNKQTELVVASSNMHWLIFSDTRESWTESKPSPFLEKINTSSF